MAVVLVLIVILVFLVPEAAVLLQIPAQLIMVQEVVVFIQLIQVEAVAPKFLPLINHVLSIIAYPVIPVQMAAA